MNKGNDTVPPFYGISEPHYRSFFCSGMFYRDTNGGGIYRCDITFLQLHGEPPANLLSIARRGRRAEGPLGGASGLAGGATRVR